jgi:hypothetical protein
MSVNPKPERPNVLSKQKVGPDSLFFKVHTSSFVRVSAGGKGVQMIETHKKTCSQICSNLQQFCFRSFPQFSTLMAIPKGNLWKIAENRTLKRGSSPPEQRRPLKGHALKYLLRASQPRQNIISLSQSRDSPKTTYAASCRTKHAFPAT